MTIKDTVTIEVEVEVERNEKAEYRIGSTPGFHSRDLFQVPRNQRAIEAFDAKHPITPPFVPLDIPEVGRTIKATLRGGNVKTFEVSEVSDSTSPGRIVRVYTSDSGLYYIDLVPDMPRDKNDILAWEYVDNPGPDLAALADTLEAAVKAIREQVRS